MRSPQELLASELKEIYSAERQLSRALPRVAKQVGSPRLREMLDQRREQGVALIEQLDEAFEEMNVSKGRQKNIAAEGLIEDMNQHLDAVDDDRFRDPLLLASMQKIEHYCIAAWGTAAAMGRLLKQQKAVQAMEQVLNEGKEFDNEMTRLAEEEVNPRMIESEEEEGEEQEGQEEEGEDEEEQGQQQGSSRGRRGGSRRQSR
jgi:ferritin-like metal-binding protein YciE